MSWIWSVSESSDCYYLCADANSNFLTRSKTQATVYEDRDKAVASLAEAFKIYKENGIDWPFRSKYSLLEVGIK